MVTLARAENPQLQSVEVVLPSSEQLEELQRMFEAQHWVKLEGFFDSDLYQQVAAMVEDVEFFARDDPLAGEDKMKPNILLGLLTFWMNDPRLFETVRRISGCGPIGCFVGRVNRRRSAAGHHHAWHDDHGDNRLVAMSVNLSREPYRGGVLQFRDRASRQLMSEVTDLGPGDAVLFRVATELEHRVTPIEGPNPRTVFVGWFRSDSRFPVLLTGGRTSAGDSQAVE